MNVVSSASAPVQDKPAAQQLLCFQLAGQFYAVNILEISEIRRYTEATTVPDVPHYVLGVINLRGVIVPVFDLRRRFGFDPVVDRNTAIIIVVVGGRNVGLVVDSVVRVQNMTADMLRPPPPLPGVIDSAFVLGLVAANERLITWLDVGQLLRHDLEAS